MGLGVIAGALTLYLQEALRGAPTIYVGGDVHTAYAYPDIPDDMSDEATVGEMDLEMMLLRDVIDWANPHADASLVLIRATDGYAFFISMDEIRTNDQLVLSAQREGEKLSYNIVGALKFSRV